MIYQKLGKAYPPRFADGRCMTFFEFCDSITDAYNLPQNKIISLYLDYLQSRAGPIQFDELRQEYVFVNYPEVRLSKDRLELVPPEFPKKEKPTMNLSTVAAIADESITTISVSFDTGQGEPGSKQYTYLCPRNLAENLSFGNLVLVQARGFYQVAHVHEVHDDPQIDPEDGKEYRWAFAQVDADNGPLATLSDIEVRQNAIVRKLENARRLSYREQTLAKLGLTAESLKALTSDDG